MKRKWRWWMEGCFVCLLLAILLALIVPSFLRQQKRGLARQIRVSLDVLAIAMKNYIADHHQVPPDYMDYRNASKPPHLEIKFGKYRITTIPFDRNYWEKIVEPLRLEGYLSKTPNLFQRLLLDPYDPFQIILFRVDVLRDRWEILHAGIAVKCPPHSSLLNVNPTNTIGYGFPDFADQNILPARYDFFQGLTLPLINDTCCYSWPDSFYTGGYIYADTSGNRIPSGEIQ